MIYLRELSEKDLVLLNTYRNNRELIKKLGSPFRFIDKQIDFEWYKHYINSRNTNVRCAICLKENDQMIGVVYLLNIDWLSKNSEFAIFIGDPKQRGKGFGRIASNLMIKHGFEDLNLNRIYLTVLSYNKKALTLYKNIGFVTEGILRQSIYKNNSYQDLIIMSILKCEYK